MGFLTGKTAIITGAGRATLSDGRCGSIGYGIATAYAKEGANLVITGRNVQKLEDAKEELERLYGIKVLAVPRAISFCWMKPFAYAKALGGVLIGNAIANDAESANPIIKVFTPP